MASQIGNLPRLLDFAHGATDYMRLTESKDNEIIRHLTGQVYSSLLILSDSGPVDEQLIDISCSH